MKPRKPNEELQGEGDYKSAQRFNEDEQAFVASGQAARATGKAAPVSPADAAEMLRAEKKGKARARGQGSLLSSKRKASE